METAIKKKDSRKILPANSSEEEEVGPLMIWNGKRSPEEVRKMSEWVSNRSKELGGEKAYIKKV